jgi:phosphoglycerol transferase MdoB-like AlkP superfamily enzyme
MQPTNQQTNNPPPNNKTITNCHSDNTKTLKQTFQAFTLTLNNYDPYNKETETTDDTNSTQQQPQKQPQPHTLKTKITQIDKQITKHLNTP